MDLKIEVLKQFMNIFFCNAFYRRDDDVRPAGYSPLVKWRFELEVTQLVLPQPIGLVGPTIYDWLVLHNSSSSSWNTIPNC